MKLTKNQVHQTGNLKLENCKNQVQIDRGIRLFCNWLKAEQIFGQLLFGFGFFTWFCFTLHATAMSEDLYLTNLTYCFSDNAVCIQSLSQQSFICLRWFLQCPGITFKPTIFFIQLSITADILSGKNARAWVSMVLCIFKGIDWS